MRSSRKTSTSRKTSGRQTSKQYTLRSMLVVVAFFAAAVAAISASYRYMRPIQWQPFSRDAVVDHLENGKTVIVVLYHGGNPRWKRQTLELFETRETREMFRRWNVIPMAASTWDIDGIEDYLCELGVASDFLPAFVIYSNDFPYRTVSLMQSRNNTLSTAKAIESTLSGTLHPDS